MKKWLIILYGIIVTFFVIGIPIIILLRLDRSRQIATQSAENSIASIVESIEKTSFQEEEYFSAQIEDLLSPINIDDQTSYPAILREISVIDTNGAMIYRWGASSRRATSSINTFRLLDYNAFSEIRLTKIAQSQEYAFTIDSVYQVLPRAEIYRIIKEIFPFSVIFVIAIAITLIISARFTSARANAPSN